MTALSDDDLFAALTQVKVFTPMLAQALADHISTKAKERDALQARLAEAERDIAQWKKVYDLRGRALQRPCINCGHVPLVIHADAARATDSADAAGVSGKRIQTA